MRKRDRKALGAYVRWVANAMGLRDWEFELKDEPPDHPEDSELATYADVRPTPGRRWASIRLCEDFRDLPPAKQRMVIVHELVHCHLAALQHQCENDMGGLLGGPAADVFFMSFRRNLEYAVDAITAALVEHLPVPEWP